MAIFKINNEYDIHLALKHINPKATFDIKSVLYEITNQSNGIFEIKSKNEVFNCDKKGLIDNFKYRLKN